MSDALFRLVGDGDRQTGGAIPLPDAFSAVVNYLIDNDSAEFRTLNRVVSTALQWKQDRIMASAWRSWEGFTRDILTCLYEMNLAKENQFSRWELTVEFVPNHRFYLPGTKIWFIGRGKADRERWEGNEHLLLALNAALEAIKDKASKADPLAVTLVQEAGKVLGEKLNLNEKPLTEGQRNYRKHVQRKPHEEGKRLRVGISSFFREFWDKDAIPAKWYRIEEIARVFEDRHPEQPGFGHADLYGSMRRVAREMVDDEKKLERRRVLGDRGAWLYEFRLAQKQGTMIGPFELVDEGLKGDPKA
jgi:hypothetical protein